MPIRSDGVASIGLVVAVGVFTCLLGRVGSDFGPATQTGNVISEPLPLIRTCAYVSAGIILVPTPFSDLILLIPLLTSMVLYLLQVCTRIPSLLATVVCMFLVAVCAVIGQVTMLIIANLFPIFGKLASPFLVFFLTHIIGSSLLRHLRRPGDGQFHP